MSTPETNAALLHALAAMNLKPRDTALIIDRLAAEFQIEVQSDAGLLTMTQNGVTANPATVLTAYAKKNPLHFYGLSPDEVKYKTDLPDTAAKTAYIGKFGQSAYEALPYNEHSPSAQNVINSTVAHAGMTRAQYKTLSIAEKAKLCGELQVQGIEAILGRRERVMGKSR